MKNRKPVLDDPAMVRELIAMIGNLTITVEELKTEVAALKLQLEAASNKHDGQCT